MTDHEHVVPVRDHLERLIAAQEHLFRAEITSLRESMTARLDASDRAVVLQLTAAKDALMINAKEIERRLELLNGEAGRLSTVLGASVPREVWEQHTQSLDEWRRGVDAQLSGYVGREKGVAVIWSFVIGSGGIVAAIVAYLVGRS